MLVAFGIKCFDFECFDLEKADRRNRIQSHGLSDGKPLVSGRLAAGELATFSSAELRRKETSKGIVRKLRREIECLS